MGIYEVLFRFLDSTGVYMGEPGTRPWAQGFPLTTQLPGGPEIPDSIQFHASDLKYPPATGTPPLLNAIRDYYNEFHDAGISTDNVAVFAGGRPGIFATVAFLPPESRIYIEETEYTPYYDLLQLLQRDYAVIPSNEENRFRPTLQDYQSAVAGQGTAAGSNSPPLFIKSNPCNPTGVTWAGKTLADFAAFLQDNDFGALIDEAYEFFHLPEPESVLKHIDDINQTNILVVGAATKGLQVPGARIGWVVASEKNIEVFRNYSSIGMGGVSRLSQILVTQLMQLPRVRQARMAVGEFFAEQRERYQSRLEGLGIRLYTGDGGFYHWGRLPGDLTATRLNERLFEYQAAILPGHLCDVKRRGDDGPHGQLFRFSFGPLLPESCDENIEILASCLD
jgi:aspartate/methionine/tyrosine aminotransferase